MQSMFRLWGADSPGDKIMEKSALHKSRQMPALEIPNLMSQMKRKRTDSPEPASTQHVHVVKKWKDTNGDVKHAVVANVNPKPASGIDSLPPMSTESKANVSAVASPEVLEARPKAQPSRKEGPTKSKVSKSMKPAVTIEPSSVTAAAAATAAATAATTTATAAVAATAAATTTAAAPTTASKTSLSALQQAIEAQINYEILLKHNELRLIDQELAKCQVSLEQLRRCSLIPFPGTEGISENVSAGIGPALKLPSGYTQPQYAAPWGVTDGPYTRHYAKWLISDVKFDPVSERALAQQAQGYFGIGEGRTTRGSFAEFGSTGKARTSRTSTGTLKLQALGENPAPAPKIDPLLHKRSTDGQWVRLFCAQCGHSNFSNTQGFLNHCRIKHNQVFKSHDAAAVACGVPVDNTEVGAPTVQATEPTTTPAATTPAITFPAITTPGNVHPLIRSNPAELAKDVHRDFCKPRDEVKSKAPAPGFSESPSTPRLSALLQQRGFGGNLQALVDSARSKVDLSAMETSDDDLIDSAIGTPIVPKPNQLARLPVAAPNVTPASKAPSGRPVSRKGPPNGPPRLPLEFPLRASHSMPGSPVDLSPHTVESNPGLVSDHDDDDDDEDGDDAHSQPDSIMNDDVVVEDASDVEGVQERTGSRQGLNSCFEKGEGSRKH